jgi:uncharacterized protein (TIGR02284 family)
MAQNGSTDWLNKLLELLHDSRDGYRECADRVSDGYLRQLFSRLAEFRQSMISELQQQVRAQAEEPEKAGSTLAAGHRLFIDLKAMITDGDPEAIIKEIERGENYTIDHYQQALREDNIPTHLKNIISTQLNNIQNNLMQIQARKGQTTPA